MRKRKKKASIRVSITSNTDSYTLDGWNAIPTLTATHWMAGMQFLTQKHNFFSLYFA